MIKKYVFSVVITILLIMVSLYFVFSNEKKIMSYYADEPLLGDVKYLKGDINGDNKVTSQDVLILQKHILGTKKLTGDSLKRADVNNDNKVTSSDYNELKKIILGLSTDDTPKYPQAINMGNYYEVVDIDVTEKEYGADPSGKNDSTSAFQKAIEKAKECTKFGPNHNGTKLCGSVIYVPAGRYLLTDSLELGPYIELIGSPDNKSILFIKHGEGRDTVKEAAIKASCMSSIKNIVFYYPSQVVDASGNTKIYPPTITFGSAGENWSGALSQPSDGISLENVFFINSYTAMDFSTTNGNNSVFFLKNIYGSPLKMGLLNDENIDTIKMDNVNFTYKYWKDFSNKKILGNDLSKDVLKDYTPYKVEDKNIKAGLKNQTRKPTGIELKRVDWSLMANVNIEGYYTGIRLSNSTRGIKNQVDGGSYVNTEGEIYDSKITDCIYPVHIVNSRHFVFTNVTLESSGGVALNIDNNTSKDTKLYNVNSEYSIYNSTISSYGYSSSNSEYAINYGGKGPISITNSKVYGKMNIQNSNKQYSFSGSTLLNTGMDSSTDKNNKNCYQESTPTLTKDISKEYAKKVKTIPKSDKVVTINITKGSYGEDISSAIEKAIKDLGTKGGIVYIPNGYYTLSKTITVPTGVEIQGATPWAHHTRYYKEYAGNVGSTVINIYSLNGAEAFKLKENSGLNGLDLISETKIETKKYLIEGTGPNIYVKNISLPGATYGIHINGDNHLIEHIWGAFYNTGIKVEGNNGIIRDCHFTPKSLINKDSKLGNEVRNNSTVIQVGAGSNEMIFHVFTIGQKTAFKFDGAKSFNAIGIGVDGDTLYPIEANNSSGKIVNAHLVTGVDGVNSKKENYRYIKTTNSNLEIINSINRANTNATAFEFTGGEIKILGGIIKHYKTQAINSSNTKLTTVGAIFVNSDNRKFTLSSTNALNVSLYGNICLDGKGGIESCIATKNISKAGKISVNNVDYKTTCTTPVSNASTQWLTLNLRKTSAYEPQKDKTKRGVTTICGLPSGYNKFKYKTMMNNTVINGVREIDIKNGCVTISIIPKPNLVLDYQLRNDEKITNEYKVPDIGKYLIFAQEYNYFLYADRDVNKNIASNDLNNLSGWAIKKGKVSDFVKSIAQEGVRNKAGYSDEEFIKYAYHGIFGRAVDDSGLKTWTNKLKTTSRSDLTIYYINHNEAQNIYKGWGYN